METNPISMHSYGPYNAVHLNADPHDFTEFLIYTYISTNPN